MLVHAPGRVEFRNGAAEEAVRRASDPQNAEYWRRVAVEIWRRQAM